MVDHDLPHYYLLPHLVFPQTVECGHQQYHIIGKQVTCQIKHITFRWFFRFSICSNGLDLCYFLQFCFHLIHLEKSPLVHIPTCAKVYKTVIALRGIHTLPIIALYFGNISRDSTESRIICCTYSAVVHRLSCKSSYRSQRAPHIIT